jgi:hypothetical protein
VNVKVFEPVYEVSVPPEYSCAVIVAIVNATPALFEPMFEIPKVSGGVVTTVFAIDELLHRLVALLFVASAVNAA